MERAKYKLSTAGMDTLMKKLSQIAQEQVDESVDGLLTTHITTNFVKVMTKVKGLGDVIERNEQLSKTYQGFLSLYGFDTMYDMYIYAKSCDVYPEELSKSSNTYVVPVQRIITRNGKALEVTVWEQLFKSEPKTKAKPKEAESNPEVRHAREFAAAFHEEKETMDTGGVAKLKIAAERMVSGNKPFNDSSKHYLTLKEGGGGVVAVIGYSEESGHLKMDFHQSNGQISGVAARGFAELIKLALKHQKGVIAEDIKEARAVYLQSGLQQDGNKWVVTFEELQAAYGESGRESE